MKDTSEYSLRRRRTPRRDGQSTRMVVLEAAGQIFAERGFAEATSKEICERAGANSAAVNYYFGGKENLYEEVLVEAHRQMVSLEELDRIILSDDLPEQKLRTFLAHAANRNFFPGAMGNKNILARAYVPDGALPPDAAHRP
jgi:AcrR family transcriptional regulator